MSQAARFSFVARFGPVGGTRQEIAGGRRLPGEIAPGVHDHHCVRDFAWQAASARDFLTRSADWPETRYERKARRLGHEVWYFKFRRI